MYTAGKSLWNNTIKQLVMCLVTNGPILFTNYIYVLGSTKNWAIHPKDDRMTYTYWGPPLRIVPSPLQTISVLASPENWAIHPILDRKKQIFMKNRIKAGYFLEFFQSIRNVSWKIKIIYVLSILKDDQLFVVKCICCICCLNDSYHICLLCL